MQLEPRVSEAHVAAAYQLFYASTMNAINAGLTSVNLDENAASVSVFVGAFFVVWVCRVFFGVRDAPASYSTTLTPPHPRPHQQQNKQTNEKHQTQIRATQAIEALVRDRIPLNGHVGWRRLRESLTELGHSEASVSLAIRVMLSRGELVRKSEGKVLQRRAA